MNHTTVFARLGARRSRLLVAAAMLLALIALTVMGLSPLMARPAADCSNGNVSSFYQDEDVTLSGNLFVTNNVTVRNDVTLTLAAGTTMTMCGAYQINVQGGGNLVAIGTEAAPITIDADDPALKWERIIFSGEANHSVLRHVVLNHGGGNDPAETQGTLEFGSTLAANALPSPTLDQVTVNESGAYGLYLRVNADDPTPPSISDVTINNSARAAILANAQALGGLGSGNVYSNNMPNTIQVISGGASRLYHSQQWRRQDVPFEFLGTATVAAASNGDPYPTLTIEAGTTFLMHPAARLEIGTSLGRGASLLAEGTAAAPITFTRRDNTSAPWDKLGLHLYADARVMLQHVAFSYGGSSSPATIEQSGAGTLTLDQVTVRNSMAAGLHGEGAVSVDESTFEFNQVGLEFASSAAAIIRNSVIRNNAEAGLRSLDANFNDNCIDAAGNFWGSASGPADAYDQADACGQAGSHAGDGDGVSGGVLYTPWLAGDGPLQDRGRIQPASFYVVADGVDSTQVTITLRDAAGNPLAGKEVQLEATNGTLVQPSQSTDAAGVTTAEISSTAPGFAYLSAYNLTDDAPVAGIGGVTFWQGAGDAGGLIAPGGAPFASPQLSLGGQPFQAGFPVSMRLPMQNSNPDPLDVEVIYGVSGLGIGTRFTPVYTATATLQPGESWDARGVWLPASSGHRCIQAVITSGDVLAKLPKMPQAEMQTTTTRQKNTQQDPCNPENLDPGNIFPRKYGGGLITLANYAYRLYVISKKSNECLDVLLSSSSAHAASEEGQLRDYEEIVTPPAYDPPAVDAQGVTAAQATALNELAQTSADLLSLNQAIGATSQRMNWAAQAGELYHLDRQYGAYRGFANRYADNLELMAGQIDTLLAVMDSDDNVYFLAEDFQTTRDQLASDGFTTEEREYYLQTGLDSDLIAQLERDVLASFDSEAHESIAFAEALRDIQADSLALAARLRDQYPAPAADALDVTNAGSLGAPQASTQATSVFVPPQVFDFTVGHPLATEEEVELVVRPVNLPLGWTYELSRPRVTLAEGATADVTLTLYPGNELLQGEEVQVTVEGYVDGDLVGGLLLEYLTPYLAARPQNLYLPLIVR